MLSNRLPVRATAQSRHLFALANEVADRCPRTLAAEIALAGSTSRGVADQYSDVEMICWAEAMPSIAEREAWLREIGAEGVVSDVDMLADGSRWSFCGYKGRVFEIGWQTFADWETNLQAVVSASTSDHDLLVAAEATAHAISLRGGARLDTWQRRLADYPPALQPKLIEAAVQCWLFYHWLRTPVALMHRDEPLELTRLLTGYLHSVLRILFALNRQWEPSWKWARHASRELAIQPADLHQRIITVCYAPTGRERIATCLQLAADTLALVPKEIDVQRPLGNVLTILKEVEALKD